ncbi:MAG: hypothetical protein IT359_06785 [Gemmatimonadaceae bacterium]|nr:hypothetical protein [Gemmatimonadaceae bacterium]
MAGRRLATPGARRVLALITVLGASACAPRVRPLTGVPYPRRIPETPLPEGHARLVFRWEYGDPIFSARGEGVARIAPPDSVRLDFFSDGNLGGGFAILIGDRLATPANDDAVRYLPPVPLLWAALGRLQVSGRDTVAYVTSDTLRADIGRSPTWRATFSGSSLIALQRVDDNRLRESVLRDSSVIRYRNYGSRRRLTLTLLRRIADPPYDEAIWHH